MLQVGAASGRRPTAQPRQQQPTTLVVPASPPSQHLQRCGDDKGSVGVAIRGALPCLLCQLSSPGQQLGDIFLLQAALHVSNEVR